MNKRLLKRHKRQVSRAKDRVRESQPDVRTPEQLTAAREASRSPVGRGYDPHANYATPAHAGTAAADTTAKEDA